MSELGQHIRLKRIEKNLSQRQLASLAGLSSGAVSMIERGDRNDLRAETVARLAAALALDFDDLYRYMRPASSVQHPAEPVPA